MPIRFVDKSATTVSGRVASTLSAFSAALAGTFTAAPARTGAIVAQLGNHAPVFTGQFQSNANRIGTIATTLAGHTAAFIADANRAPVWSGVPNFTSAAGAFSQSVASFVTDPDGDTLTYSIAPSSPTTAAQLAAAGLTLNPNTGVISGTYNGATLTVIVRADDSATASLEADWNARTAGTGVVWFHDFRSDAEVNAFRFTGGFSGGNDPLSQGTGASLLRRITTDGMASGACLECFMPAGTSSANSVWWRPFSPMTAPGNGKAANDPGANGTITPKAWNPTSGSSTLANFDNGWYGNALYADADPTHFEGTEFYCQLVVKMDPRRITGGNQVQRVGKFIWFTQAHSGSSFEPAEHVFWSYGDGGNQGTQNYLRCYVARAGGTDPLDDIDPGTRIQPGSSSSADWYWSGGWDVVLIHLRLGQANVSSGANATLLEIWAAHQGETTYTKIWNQEYSLTNFPNGGRNGIQSFIGSAYNNNGNQLPGGVFPQAFFHRYAQIIFSKNTIPCPQVWPP